MGRAYETTQLMCLLMCVWERQQQNKTYVEGVDVACAAASCFVCLGVWVVVCCYHRWWVHVQWVYNRAAVCVRLKSL